MSETARPRRGGNGATPRADTSTPNLGLVQPEVGASNSTWGNKLNANFGILDNSLQITGGTINGDLAIGGTCAISGAASVGATFEVGSTGIAYGGVGGTNRIAYAWAGGFINAYIDGNYVGNLATTQYALPVSGGQISYLNVDGLLSVFGGCNIDAGALVAYGGASVIGRCTADTLASTGNADIAGDVFAANLVTSGAVFAAQGYKPGGGLWTDSSDERLKRDIHDYHAGLRAVCSLRPVTYKFNGLGGTTDDGRTHTGLIAQEAELVMPELVSVRKAQLRPGDPYDEGILTLDPTPLFYALVNACRELSAAVEKLEKQNVTLLGRIRALENRL